jgi:putative ABC transport system permease protein
MLQDIRFGLRMLVRNPAVTALATIALALGIGGSTVIFSVVNAVLLRPLPVSDPDRLVSILANSQSRNLAYLLPAYSTYAEWKANSPSFESMSAFASASATLLLGNDSERVNVLKVNATYFSLLCIRERAESRCSPTNCGTGASDAPPTSSAAPSTSMARALQ